MTNGAAKALDPADQQLLDYLHDRWSELFRLTTLEQAMAALGQAHDARRLRLGDYLLAHPASHPVVERWGARTFILTEDEKLLGRYLAQVAPRAPDVPDAEGASDSGGPIPLVEVAAAVGRGKAAVERGLNALQRVGLLEWHLDGDPDGGAVAYALARDWEHLAGPLGFTFHTVQRETGERFNVPWAVDFLLLVSSDYPDERVEIFDSCAHCTDRIHAVMDRGRIVAVSPPEALVFRGGGWRDTALFRSEEHLRAWLAEHPLLASGDAAAARRRWLEEFPNLALSDLGRAFQEARTLPGWNQIGATRLAEFYTSELFRAMAPHFARRMAELRAQWRAGG